MYVYMFHMYVFLTTIIFINFSSVRKGDSLYESIYHKQKRLPLPTKVAVARQIAQVIMNACD